jgi:hypothetical protein
MQKIITKIKSNLKIFTGIIITILIMLSVFIYYNKKSQNLQILLSERYYEATILINKKKYEEGTVILENIIAKQNKLYSPLSLFVILEKDLITDEDKVLDLFDKIISIKKIEEENLNLIKIKKALYISNSNNEIELLNLLNPIINSESIWKKEAITILGNYFFNKGEKIKANNYYKLLKSKKVN